MRRFNGILNSVGFYSLAAAVVFGGGFIFASLLVAPLSSVGAKALPYDSQEVGAIVSFFEQDKSERLAKNEKAFCHTGTFLQVPAFFVALGRMSEGGWKTTILGQDASANTVDFILCWGEDDSSGLDDVPTSNCWDGIELPGESL